MPKKRRRLPPGVPSLAVRFATAAKAGVIASSSGSESKMPAPRRNLRRESGERVETKGALVIIGANGWRLTGS